MHSTHAVAAANRADIHLPALEPESDSTGETRLSAYLARIEITATILRPGVPMPTVPLAAAAIGVHENQIIKSLLFLDSTGSAVLAIASGVARIDRKLLAGVANSGKLRLADAATVFAATGYPAGGVAPIGHAKTFPVVIDSRVMTLEVVYGGAGSEETLLQISPSEIQRLTNATIADIVESRYSAS